MSTQITEVPAEQGTEQDPRDAMMHAFAVAETVVAQLPDRPTSVDVRDNWLGGYELRVYFHNAPDCVERFGSHFDVTVTARQNGMGSPDTHTSAVVVVDGVHVQAWALMRTEQVAS